MGWKDLLQENETTVVAPWLGGRVLRFGMRTWTIEGALPPEHGWFTFRIAGRKATAGAPAAITPSDILAATQVRGFLVGDRLVLDNAFVDPDPAKIIERSERVHLLDPGLERFARITAGRPSEDSPLVFIAMEYPLGPEPQVVAAYEDRKDSVTQIPGVTPALDAAFRMESYQRAEAERRRAEAERRRLELEARRAEDERRAELAKQLGTGEGRRAMAQVDFAGAARAALAVGGAEYLDHRAARGRNEMVVRFRLLGRRFECTCDARTLQIIDAGICLINHATEERGDTYFTLESLPAVIQEAERGHKLVVFRHVN